MEWETTILGRADFDSDGRAKLVARAEYTVQHSEHEWVGRRSIEEPGLSEQSVDPPGAESLEVVSSSGKGVEDLGQIGPDR